MAWVRAARGATVGLLALGLVLGATACGNPFRSPDSGSDGAAKSGGQLQLPQRTVYLEGSRTPSPAPAAGVPSPAATKRRPVTTDPMIRPTGVVTVTCPGRARQGVMNGLDVVMASASASVSWPAVGDPTVRHYLLAAVPQVLVHGTQAPLRWQTVPAPGGCGSVTATVTGLTGRSAYIFWLRVVTDDRVHGGTNDTWIARSSPLTTP